MRRAERLLLVPAALGLLAGMWAGLIRLGWDWPTPARLPLQHGALMVSGFLGTVITLERAVARGRAWAFGAPAACSLGALLTLAMGSGPLPNLLFVLGSVVLLAIFVSLLRQQPALFMGVMALGGVLWAVGNGLLLFERPVAEAVRWWIGFVVLTIAGERLELSRMRQLKPRHERAFALGCAILVSGLVIGFWNLDAGVRIQGLGLLWLVAWLVRYDVARRTVRRTGITRFIALCILSGYAWLTLAGALSTSFGMLYAGPRYDALIHAIFIGYVLSMILGHAPIILPAVAKLRVNYTPWLYLPLGMLHASLTLRVGGDLLGSAWAREVGGLLNVVTVLVFMGIMARRTRPERAPIPTPALARP